MKPLLLGEAPSRAGDRYWMFPLSGRPAERICALIGWERSGAAYWTLTERFDTLNAIERYADAYPWSVVRARERWTCWFWDEDRVERPRIVVCFGRRAAGAVGLSSDQALGEWFEAGLLKAVVLPHTSGRNRAWNDPATEGLVRRVLGEALEYATLPA